MKASKYNIILTMDDGTKIAFNSMTCALAEINEDFIEIIEKIDSLQYEKLDAKQKLLVDKMLEGNYIVHDNIDELKLIKYKHLSGKFNNESLGLTIAPTLSCNFECPYCYENPKQSFIKEDVVKGILEMVSEAAKRKKGIYITWYGGEPLIAKDILFDMSQKMINICRENETNYSAYIVTNGYLINDEIICKFKEAKINSMQITIDGPPYIHNKRRKLKGSDEGTFDVILSNVKKLSEAGMNVTIRVNIDKTNIDKLEELLDILEINGLKNIQLTLGQVTAYTEACASVAETCLNTEEFAKVNIILQDILHKRGFISHGYPYYPGTKANYCTADSISSFVVDPDGYMYKCWNDIGNIKRAVGNIKKFKEILDHDMYARHINYILWSPFDHKECIECELLPICMGGCPYNGEKNGSTPDCEKWKYNLEEILKLTYMQKKDMLEENLEQKGACSC